MNNKKILTSMAAALMSAAALAQAPAFPGAEGHGRYVTGGRGGKVIHVTNLNDKGTGSFRAAVTGNSKKIIVFDVAGVIPLASDLTIGSNTTILGQTAPSPGITLRYYTVRPEDNCIIRFIRLRRGQEKDVNDGADATWQRNKTGIIFDHCSFSWSIDEVASFYDNNNFTMQWCTVAESLTNPGHSKGAHGYGGIWGGKLAPQFYTMSHKGKRLLCLIDEFSSLSYRLLINLWIRIIRCNFFTFYRLPLTSCNLSILCKVEHYWTRTTTAGNIKRTTHSPGNILRTTNLISPFRDWLGNTHQVNLLESICTQSPYTYLSGNNHDRCRIHHGISNTCKSISCSRTTGHECYAHFATDSGIALCSVSSSLLMTYQDVIKHLLLSSRVTIQCIKHWHDAATWITEDGLNPFVMQ